MQTAELPLHEIAIIAVTRAVAGAGVGLLVAGKLNEDQRTTAGWVLLTIGVLSTVPLAVSLYRRLR